MRLILTLLMLLTAAPALAFEATWDSPLMSGPVSGEATTAITLTGAVPVTCPGEPEFAMPITARLTPTPQADGTTRFAISVAVTDPAVATESIICAMEAKLQIPDVSAAVDLPAGTHQLQITHPSAAHVFYDLWITVPSA